MKGRKPTPLSLRLLGGNAGHRPLHPEATPPPAPLTPPAWLEGPVARAEWARLAPELLRQGLLTQFDLALFGCWCEAFAAWRHVQDQADAAEQRDAALYPVFAGMAAKRRAEVARLAGEFGFSPVARARIHAQPPEQPGRLAKYRTRVEPTTDETA